MSPSIRMAYVTTYDARNILNWSGLGYYMAKSFQDQSISLYYLGPLKEKYPALFKGKQFYYKYFLGKRHLRDREPAVLKSYAEQVSRQLSGLNVDVVFSPGTIPIAYLDCRQPIVFWTGSSFAGMVDLYPEFSNLSRQTIKNGHAMEKAALTRARLAIYASEWGTQTALAHYQADPARVTQVPYGANLEVHHTMAQIREFIAGRLQKRCRLLFMGVDWFRKGGDIALAAAQELNDRGLPTELAIVGCQPPDNVRLPGFVQSFGFLSKATPQGIEEISRLLARSHFLILPTRAENFGVVFCEANCFGVPCLATAVGGVTGAIRNGVNGMTFAPDAPISAYCDYIYSLFLNFSQYEELAQSSFNEYQSRLNWPAAARRVRKLLLDILD